MTSRNFSIVERQFSESAYDTFDGAIVCTDGVSFAEGKAELFVRDFCRENFNRTCRDISDDLTRLLENWQSPDDKTTAFVLPHEYEVHD